MLPGRAGIGSMNIISQVPLQLAPHLQGSQGSYFFFLPSSLTMFPVFLFGLVKGILREQATKNELCNFGYSTTKQNLLFAFELPLHNIKNNKMHANNLL